MSGIDLDAIRARADAATPGPWAVDGFLAPGPGDSFTVGPAYDGALAYVQPVWADAEFIAAARSDVPVLVAALRDVLDLHTPEQPRRDPDFHHTDRVCIECGDPFPCRTYTAVTAHIDTTPKEKP